MNGITRFAQRTLGGLAATLCLVAVAACDGNDSKATPRPASEPPTGWRTFGDAKLRFSIAYPSGWIVDAHYVYPERLNGTELHGVSFTVPERFGAGTNLAADTHLAVESMPGAAHCDASLFLDSPQDELTENDGGHSWSVATGGDAGAGNFYEETVYALTDSAPCLAVRYFIHYTNVANYEPGTIKEFDRRALVTMFDRIRSTLDLPGGPAPG
jgi:hypothetical protein